MGEVLILTMQRNYILLLISTFWLFMACGSPVNFKQKARVVGHGGMGVNSWLGMDNAKSFKKCLENGADGVEMDVQLTADSVLVVYHDETIRINGEKKRINECEWDELAHQEVRYSLFNKGKLQRLEELVSSLTLYKPGCISLDCKFFPADKNQRMFYFQWFSEQIAAFTLRYPYQYFTVESNQADFLKLLIKTRTNYQVFAYSSSLTEAEFLINEYNVDGISIRNDLINKEQVESFQQKHKEVILWSVSSKKQNLEAAEKNPNYIQTDNVKSLLKIYSTLAE